MDTYGVTPKGQQDRRWRARRLRRDQASAGWGEVSVGPVWALAVGGVMPWKPQHPDDFPTLGWGVLDWWADLFPSPRDPAEPFVLTDSQARGCWSGSGWIR